MTSALGELVASVGLVLKSPVLVVAVVVGAPLLGAAVVAHPIVNSGVLDMTVSSGPWPAVERAVRSTSVANPPDVASTVPEPTTASDTGAIEPSGARATGQPTHPDDPPEVQRPTLDLRCGSTARSTQRTLRQEGWVRIGLGGYAEGPMSASDMPPDEFTVLFGACCREASTPETVFGALLSHRLETRGVLGRVGMRFPPVQSTGCVSRIEIFEEHQPRSNVLVTGAGCGSFAVARIVADRRDRSMAMRVIAPANAGTRRTALALEWAETPSNSTSYDFEILAEPLDE